MRRCPAAPLFLLAEINKLFFVGASTHPGTGVPIVLVRLASSSDPTSALLARYEGNRSLLTLWRH